MSLNIKKPNIIDTSKIELDKELLFNSFLKHLENSWKVKNIELEEGYIKQSTFDNGDNKNISLIIEDLKNKSLITYIDAPWGSGKTYFIEELIKWIKINKIEVLFSDNKSTLEINVLDAWEIYNTNNLENILINLFKVDQKKFEDFYKNQKIIEEINKSIANKLARTIFLESKKILDASSIVVPFYKIELGKLVPSKKEWGKIWWKHKKYESYFISQAEENAFKIIFGAFIENKYIKNNKMIIIDNIERLPSKNRHEVVNKILNWANLSGTTYIFLTNFDKIKFSKLYEEDFWNKISLNETFKLTNNWKAYINNYSYDEKFIMKNYLKLNNFIIQIIPIFFNSNEDNMDIREIKKLLNNWIKHFSKHLEKNNQFQDEKLLIISFMKEILKHIKGLDKYFFINKAIDILATKYWEFWETDEVLNDIDIEKTYQPLLNNKMFRIQSNFYNLNVKIIKNAICFSNQEFLISQDEEKYFLDFNNFIDDEAATAFKDIISDLFKTRKIEDKEHELFKYITKFNKLNNNKINELKYFEFKYNNIKKFHIYNVIFNEK